MSKLKIVFTTLLLLLSLGVSNATNNRKATTKHHTTASCKTKTNHTLKGSATFYGNKYRKGRITASGKVFDKDKFTAAHKTLPFGTIVLVTNTKTGDSVEVEITDRGPFGKGRVIDLSVAAFKAIGDLKHGVLPVELKIVSQPTT